MPQRFLNGRPGYDDWFVTFSAREAISPDHLQLILRPRTSELLTPFRTIHGVKWVWTTFGPDQVDLNFRNPEVLLRVLEILLLYYKQGDSTAEIAGRLGTSRSTIAVTLFRIRARLRAILKEGKP